MTIISGSALPTLAPCSSTEQKEVGEILFVVYGREFHYVVKGFDKKGDLLSQYCFTIPYLSFFPFGMGFVGVGSTMYMIGGDKFTRNPHKSFPSLEVYTLDLKHIPSSLSQGCLLPNYVQLAPTLNAPKFTPIVFLVRGCIYVLSKFLEFKDYNPNFEVLDSSSGAWRVLPDPPLRVNYSKLPYGYGFKIESHAVKDDNYIVISVCRRMGLYVFDVSSCRWDFVGPEPLSFFGKSVSLNGFHYAFSQPNETFRGVVHFFSDTMGSPLGEMKIQPPSPNVRWGYLSELVVMSDMVFVVRVGFAEFCSSNSKNNGENHYMTVDRFKVRLKEKEGTLKPLATKRRSNIIQLEDARRRCGSTFLYCVPLSLS